MKVDFSERTARVCFNTNEWRRPSGPSGKAISKCFEKQRGFGFDEWLNNPIKYGDWYYAFIQGAPIEKEKTYYYGKIKLYAYSRGVWYDEGYINDVETISDDVAREVIAAKQEWVEHMHHSLDCIFDENGKEAKFFFDHEVKYEPHHVINVRFKACNMHIKPNISTPAKEHPNNYHYWLCRVK